MVARAGAVHNFVSSPEYQLDDLEAIVFDFDGVILESAALKGDAFLELFSDHPEHLEAITAHHLANLGVSRFEKFDWIYRNLFQQPLPESNRQELGRRYSDIVFTRTVGSPFVPGASELLEHLVGRVPLFVASATPQTELEAVVRKRELGRFFVGVHGSPPRKEKLLTEIVRHGGFKSECVLMIGDGVSDLEAARHAGCLFVARIDESAPEQPFPADTPRVRTLTEFVSLL